MAQNNEELSATEGLTTTRGGVIVVLSLTCMQNTGEFVSVVVRHTPRPERRSAAIHAAPAVATTSTGSVCISCLASGEWAADAVSRTSEPHTLIWSRCSCCQSHTRTTGVVVVVVVVQQCVSWHASRR